MSPRPVVFVEDDQYQVSAAEQLESQLGTPVTLVRSYAALLDTVAELAEDPDLRKPVVVLDPGLPDICRLETVRCATAALGRRASIIQWTSSRAVATHTGALLEGARASLPKWYSAPALASVVRRVSADRFWCEPGQAQWFIDLLTCVQEHSLRDTSSSVWQDSELLKLPEPEWFATNTQRLASMAEGGELGANDDWFDDMLTVARRWWLNDRQREIRTAVLATSTRKEAGKLTGGIQPGTVDAHMARIGGRLMPYKYLASTPRDDSHWLTRVLVEMHIPCELSTDDHLAMLTRTAPAAPFVDDEEGTAGDGAPTAPKGAARATGRRHGHQG